MLLRCCIAALLRCCVVALLRRSLLRHSLLRHSLLRRSLHCCVAYCFITQCFIIDLLHQMHLGHSVVISPNFEAASERCSKRLLRHCIIDFVILVDI
jgi:hypothetical protein